MDPIIFRQYDIRGIVETHLDSAFSYSLGKALVSYMSLRGHENKVTVGHDARLSSPKLYESLIAGLTEHGAHVVKLGLITTPISYYSTHAIDNVAMSIIVTASHNPPEYNGFKLTYNKSNLQSQDIKEIKTIIETNKSTKKLKGNTSSFDIITSYINRYTEEFKHLTNIPIVMDCGNGTAGVVLRKLMEQLGLNCEILFEKPDGNFPNHHPDPTVESNLKELANKVIATNSVAGIGFDGDADRIGVVDEAGKFILGDELIYIFAKDILQTYKSETIVADVKCSDKLFSSIDALGGTGLMYKTGHSLIKQKIKDENALLGGELSGHICFRDRNYGYDDAIYAALRLIELLVKSKKSISSLLEGLPKTYSTPEIRLKMSYKKREHLMKKVKKHFKHNTDEYSVNHIDGVRISFKNGWALIRISHTGPILTLRFESTTSEGLARIRSKIETFIKTNEKY